MMRSALRSNNTRRQVSVGNNIPASVGGWDAQSPLAAMPAKNAVQLDNFIARQGYIELRRGYVPIKTGLGSVESLMVWRGGGAAANHLLACNGAHITQVLPSVSTLYTTAVNDRWQYVNFANDGGTFIIAVNGANIPQIYDGTSFADSTISGSSGPITLDPTTLIDVMAHNNRLYFIEENSLHVWFLDPEAIQGTSQLLDLGSLFQLGGVLAAMGTWSFDGGQGPADMAVFVTTQGEVAIYQGTDPSDITNWALIGRYSLGVPLGKRALMKYGADLLLLTTDGVIPMSQALKLDRAQDNLVALTARIQHAFSLAVQQYGANFGWQGMFYPGGSLAIFNIPVQAGVQSVQYVQSMIGGGWSQFVGLNAFCWDIANDIPYFGGLDGVYQWDTGSQDGGNPIVGDLLTAYNYFSSEGVNKKFEMLRPLIQQTASVTTSIALVTDYRTEIPTNTPTPPPASGGAMWDDGVWDGGVWSGEDVVNRYNWTSVQGIGFCGAVRLRASVSSVSAVTYQIIAFDVLYQRGGVL